MSERESAVRPLRTSAESPPDTDIRLRLEGRAELVETARERHVALEGLLSRRRWLRRFRENPGSVQELLREEPALEEALTRIRRRAEAEGWPEDTPVLASLRELSALRARLTERLRKRLGRLKRPEGEPSFQEELSRLESLALQVIPKAPPGGEGRLLEGGCTNWGASDAMFVAILLSRLGNEWLQYFSLVFAGVCVGLSALLRLRSGRYWLTSERLVWKPFVGEPVQLSLRSIPPGGIQCGRMSTVSVEGEYTVRLNHVVKASQLAALLEMYRQPPFLGTPFDAQRLAQACCYKARLREDTRVIEGYAILRPDSISFLPRRAGTEALRAIVGAPASAVLQPTDIPLLIRHLRGLPDSEFDTHLARAVEAVGGVRWSSSEATHDATQPLWRALRITSGSRTLIGKLSWSQQQETQPILASWHR